MLIMGDEFADYQSRPNNRAKNNEYEESSEVDGEPKTQLGHYNASKIELSDSIQNTEEAQIKQKKYKEANMTSTGQLMLSEQNEQTLYRATSNLEFAGPQDSERHQTADEEG